MMNVDKRLTVTQLMDVLSKIPSAWHVEVNAVGNLMVSDEEASYKGFIDFLCAGTYEGEDEG